MSEVLITLEVDVAVESYKVEELITDFDGTIDRLHIENAFGKKIVADVLHSKLTEVSEVSEDGDVTSVISCKPDIKYHLSTNKTFTMSDILRIEGYDYYIIITPNYSSLFNADYGKLIELLNITSLEDLKAHLEINHPDYEVLRKIK